MRVSSRVIRTLGANAALVAELPMKVEASIDAIVCVKDVWIGSKM